MMFFQNDIVQWFKGLANYLHRLVIEKKSTRCLTSDEHCESDGWDYSCMRVVFQNLTQPYEFSICISRWWYKPRAIWSWTSRGYYIAVRIPSKLLSGLHYFIIVTQRYVALFCKVSLNFSLCMSLLNFNALWSVDATWRQRSRSPFIQVMACRQLAAAPLPANHCWLIVNQALGFNFLWNMNQNMQVFIRMCHLQNLTESILPWGSMSINRYRVICSALTYVTYPLRFIITQPAEYARF